MLREEGVSGVSRAFEAFILMVAERRHANLWLSKPPLAPAVDSADSPTIANFFPSAGILPGDTVMLHSSWDQLRLAYQSPQDVIRDILNYLGPSGTLAMPAMPVVSGEQGIHIDFDKVFSKAGMVSEVFRRMPNVSRSVSYNHSVSALGPNAEFLTAEHHRGRTSWDGHSPYRKLASIPESWVVGYGVGRKLRAATALHCVESELIGTPYFSKLFREEFSYSYSSGRYGSGRVTQLVRRGVNYSPKIAKHFAADELKEKALHGVDFYAVRAPILIEKSIELGRKGKTMYIWPIPWKWHFRKSHMLAFPSGGKINS